MAGRILCLLAIAVSLIAQHDAGADARKALDLLIGQKYADLSAMFTPEMAKALPEAALAKVAGQLQALGPIQTVGEPRISSTGALSVVVLPVKFEQAALEARFSFTGAGRIAGMFLSPSAAAEKWERPSYSAPDSFSESAVTIGEDKWKLPGTLTLPLGKGPFPAVVLVHGSGGSDRDETVGGVKVFRDLAEGLASRGVASVRYEKRTKAYGAEMAALKKFTVMEETVQDALRAAALLRRQPEIDAKRVFVIGHSLGGTLAPRVAANDGELAGIVILAGSLRPMPELLIEQMEYLGAERASIEAVRAEAAKIKALKAGDDEGAPILNAPPSYWLDLGAYDAAATAAKLKMPILVLQGERDYQVTMKDFTLWKSALGNCANASFHSFPALNHLFVAGEGKSLPAEYQKPGHVAAQVIAEIAKFVSGR